MSSNTYGGAPSPARSAVEERATALCAFRPNPFRRDNFSELLGIYTTLLVALGRIDMVMVSILALIVLVFAIGTSAPANHDVKFFR